MYFQNLYKKSWLKIFSWTSLNSNQNLLNFKFYLQDLFLLFIIDYYDTCNMSYCLFIILVCIWEKKNRKNLKQEMASGSQILRKLWARDFSLHKFLNPSIHIFVNVAQKPKVLINHPTISRQSATCCYYYTSKLIKCLRCTYVYTWGALSFVIIIIAIHERECGYCWRRQRSLWLNESLREEKLLQYISGDDNTCSHVIITSTQNAVLWQRRDYRSSMRECRRWLWPLHCRARAVFVV